MATTFNMLRANDLIWSFVVNNYLLGKEPFPFDLLYWNSDSTRMPYAMHSFYLHKFYQGNKLIEPGGIVLCDVPIDLRKIRLPVYMLSTREIIAPWAYLRRDPAVGGTRGSSWPAPGISPAWSIRRPSRSTATGPTTGYRRPQEWLAGASEHAGSWWPTERPGRGEIGAEGTRPAAEGRQARAARGRARCLCTQARRVSCSAARQRR